MKTEFQTLQENYGLLLIEKNAALELLEKRIDRGRDCGQALQAYYAATDRLSRALLSLQNHPDMDCETWARLFEPHPVPYPVSC